MKKRYNTPEDWEAARDKLIGLGEASMRKSYYPELLGRLADLESTVTQLDRTRVELKKQVKELERFCRISVNRELRIIELKDKVARLEKELAQYKQTAA